MASESKLVSDNPWIEESQLVEFPSGISKLDRIRIRKAIIDQEDSEDDRDDCGIVILGDNAQAVTAILDKRVATAFKTVLGDICGHPTTEFLEEFYAWKKERSDQMETEYEDEIYDDDYEIEE